MSLYTLLQKARTKFLRMLLGGNTYSLVERINRLGRWYDIQKYAPEIKYPAILSDWYRERTGTRLNLEHPRTYNEKIQWLKLNDATPLKTRLSDKYLVRQWVTEKAGERYLVPLLGVWDSFEDIDFDTLPGRFVLKANHGCGWNIIVKRKSALNKALAKRRCDLWMQSNFAFCVGLELQYRDIEPKIIAETYLEDESGGLADYKVYCFAGKPFCVEYFSDSFGKRGVKTMMYDLNWNPAGWTLDAHQGTARVIQKPECFDEMIRIAAVLCAEFNHVRVDFHLVRDRVYFGEMTFTSASGLEHFEPEAWNLKLGDMIKLPID